MVKHQALVKLERSNQEAGKALAHLEQSEREYALAQTFEDFLDVHRKQSVLEALLKKAGAEQQLQDRATKAKLATERRLGQLCPSEQGKRTDLTSPPEEAKLDQIARSTKEKWKSIASIPDETYHGHVEQVIASGEELTRAGVLQLAKRLKREQARRKAAAAEPPAHPLDVASSGRFRVEQGDCLEWLAAQPADSCNLVLGSPPYEMARLYLEDGENLGVARPTEEWVAWMVEVYKAALRCCTGLVAFVVEGQTKYYSWSAGPALLMAGLHGAGVCLRKPPVYHRVGIPGSGGPDWLRNDYEFIVCATRGGRLPWSNNVAMGKPCEYRPGGDPSHRTQDGDRVNGVGYASMEDRNNMGPHRARQRGGRIYDPPEIANPGNVIECSAGGGNMGDSLCHDNEAPFPEDLAEFFVRSFCPPNGIVCDPFSGSGTTGAVAIRHGRRFAGCDLRRSQVELSLRRITRVQPLFPLGD